MKINSGFESKVNEEFWFDLEDQKNYTVVLSNFLARGGQFTALLHCYIPNFIFRSSKNTQFSY